MLKDIRDLGIKFKLLFLEISRWNELAFNNIDKEKLSALENVIKVDSHSVTLKMDENHCVVPSQYFLYAVFIKEFAIELRKHIDVFEIFKKGRSQNEVGEKITEKSFDLQNQGLDEWSLKLALKPFTDSEFNFDAKSIINKSQGRYKVRGTSDFFTSVILKIINVPDASSSILGKIIYSLTGEKELYWYLENRFLKDLPFIRKENTTNRFLYEVLSYLFHYDQFERVRSIIVENKEKSFLSIKTDRISLTTLFRKSDRLLSDNELSQGGKIRFFNNPIFRNQNGEYLYLSTEWTNGTGGRLDLDNFAKLVQEYYPEFDLDIIEDIKVFKHKASSKFYKAIPQIEFDIDKLISDVNSASLFFRRKLFSRFISSLLTKPFVILSGLSGSGKTKLAQAFAQWICQDESQYCIVPVGADWTNREPLLGYPNALNTEEYVKPDNGALELIINANNHPELPYFLILDEMNLSHVERYFADFLSVMESKGEISLFAEGAVSNGVPSKLSLPSNLFIIGTVNIDETTYMFSPKVLDRANAIEFRVTKDEISKFFTEQKELDMDQLKTKGASMAQDFLRLAENKDFENQDLTQIHTTLVDFFEQLKKAGAEFGYRSGAEIIRLINQLHVVDNELTEDEKLDIAIMQKLLPKLHGSRRKLCPVLITLGQFCVDNDKFTKIEDEIFSKEDFNFEADGVKYPLSLEKIYRMYRGAIDNGFASYAEA